MVVTTILNIIVSYRIGTYLFLYFSTTKFRHLIIYDFGFLDNAHSFKPPTPTLEKRKIDRIDSGIDFHLNNTP